MLDYMIIKMTCFHQINFKESNIIYYIVSRNVKDVCRCKQWFPLFAMKTHSLKTIEKRRSSEIKQHDVS